MGVKKNRSTRSSFTFYSTVFILILTIFNISCVLFNSFHNPDMQKDSVEYARDIYIQRLESKFNAARENLASEIDGYIKNVAPTATLNSLNLIDLCNKYNVDIRLALSQAHIESHFGTLGTARHTNSVFNVGAFDGHSAKTQIKNGYGYKHPDYSVEPYLQLLTSRYLVNGKTEDDLIRNFVDKKGARYATSKTYETSIKERWNYIDKYTDIDSLYNEYKKYKTLLGR